MCYSAAVGGSDPVWALKRLCVGSRRESEVEEKISVGSCTGVEGRFSSRIDIIHLFRKSS